MQEHFIPLILSRFRLMFPLQISESPAYLRDCSGILRVNFPHLLEVYRTTRPWGIFVVARGLACGERYGLCLFSFHYSGKIPLLTKRVMTLLIVYNLSVTLNALFDHSYLALGHAIGFRVIWRSSLLFWSQRETILSKFLSVNTASLVAQNLFGYTVSSIYPPLLEVLLSY